MSDTPSVDAAQKNTERIGRSAAIASAVTAMSRIIGFGRVLLVTAVLGTTYLGNTYIGANSLSNVAFELLAAGALSSVLVPTFATMLREAEDQKLRVLVGELAGFAMIVLGLLSVATMCFAPTLGRILAAGSSDPEIRSAQGDLGAYLIRWFAPQIALYGIGAIATAVLHAKRRFATAAGAPIASTIVMAMALVGFRISAHGGNDLALSRSSKAWLGVAGTGGVIGFVAVLFFAAGKAGSWVVPRVPTRRNGLGGVLRVAMWGVLLHSIAGALFGVAIVLGNAVSGGVVAYQTAFVFFLAPYAILAQPIAAALLPEMSVLNAANDNEGFAAGLSWATRRTVVLVGPVSALSVALAVPAMRGIAFGEIDLAGATLIGSAFAGLAIGLLPYSLFMLYARAHYALADSRTPAYAALLGAVVGCSTMLIATIDSVDISVVARLGLGHSVGYLCAAVVLGKNLALKGLFLHHDLLSAVRPLAVAFVLGAAGWGVYRIIAPGGRFTTAATVVCVSVIALAVYGAVVLRHNRDNRPQLTNG